MWILQEMAQSNANEYTYLSMIFSKFDSRNQVDLNGFQSQPNKQIKFIMVYQNLLHNLLF